MGSGIFYHSAIFMPQYCVHILSTEYGNERCRYILNVRNREPICPPMNWLSSVIGISHVCETRNQKPNRTEQKQSICGYFRNRAHTQTPSHSSWLFLRFLTPVLNYCYPQLKQKNIYCTLHRYINVPFPNTNRYFFMHLRSWNTFGVINCSIS